MNLYDYYDGLLNNRRLKPIRRIELTVKDGWDLYDENDRLVAKGSGYCVCSWFVEITNTENRWYTGKYELMQ